MSKRMSPMKQQRRNLVKKQILIIFIIALTISTIYFVIKKDWVLYGIVFVAINVIFNLYFYIRNILKISGRIKKMEEVFPDFLQLMASNLRAGITIERAMLMSSRPEFKPLDNEILRAGRDIATGKDIQGTLTDMSERINSEKIRKTILLIISGIKAGGNISTLLEQVSVNMRERIFVEKRASSAVMMYVIFIFIAVTVGAPALFSLSTILVEILTKILGNLPAMESSTTMSLPFTLSSISISINFIKYFALIFMIVIDVLACLIIGLVNKGEEKEGLKYIAPVIAISLAVFFLARYMIRNFMTGMF